MGVLWFAQADSSSSGGSWGPPRRKGSRAESEGAASWLAGGLESAGGDWGELSHTSCCCFRALFVLPCAAQLVLRALSFVRSALCAVRCAYCTLARAVRLVHSAVCCVLCAVRCVRHSGWRHTAESAAHKHTSTLQH